MEQENLVAIADCPPVVQSPSDQRVRAQTPELMAMLHLWDQACYMNDSSLDFLIYKMELSTILFIS